MTKIAVSDITLDNAYGGGQLIAKELYQNLSKYYEIYPINIYGVDSAFNLIGDYLHKKSIFRKLKIGGLLRRYHFMNKVFSHLFIKKLNYNVELLISNNFFDKMLIDNIKFKNIIIINHAASTISGLDKFIDYVKLMKKHCKKFSVITLNKTHYSLLNKVFPGNVKLVYNGISSQKVIAQKSALEKFNLDNKKFVLYLGRLHESGKKVSYIIKAFSMLKETNLYLVIAGDGPDFKNYISLSKELNIEKNVIFTGFIQQNEKYLLFKTAEIVIQPSLNENFSLVTIEAMQQGAIVITTKNDGSQDIIEDGKNGFFTKINEQDIKNKIEYILRLDQEKINNIKENAIKTSNKFTLEKMINDYKSLIDKILE